MSAKTDVWLPALAGGAIFTIFTLGCASKGYVRQTVEPLDRRVSGVEERSGENTKKLGELETDISRVEERAIAADNRAGEAGRQAADAGRRADEAAGRADDARGLAENSLARVDGLEHKVENIENYQLVSTSTVLFGFGRSDLSEEAKAELDAAARSIDGIENFVLEVRGFTDSVGSRELNLSLSRRRAEAVVRYLTVEHQLPLHRIHVLGLGAEDPVADNQTRTGRQANRRVEVSLFVPDTGGLAESARAASTK